MPRKALVLTALLAMLAGVPRAQNGADAAAVLRAAAAAMGTANVKAIQYTGTGWNAMMGQSYLPNEDWPKCELTSYMRAFNYDERSSREEWTRIQGSYPRRGGGGIPVDEWIAAVNGVWTQKFYQNGDYGWTVDGTNVSVANRLSTSGGGMRPDVRQLDVWLSPHGFLKAAMAAKDASAVSLMLDGEQKTVVTVTVMNKFRVNGTINANNMVERVQTWVPNPVFGDMVFEHRYTDYKDFGGVKVPTLIHSHQGDPRVNPGHNFQEIKVANVMINPSLPPLTVPENVRNAPTAPSARVASTQVAPGLWRIAGEAHHSFLVEFRDFLTVIEAPQDELRSLAVIAEVHKLVPNKPIQYVVNTHHHFDHSGGLRTYVAQGVTVVTHAANKPFYRDVVFYPLPRTLEPDLLSLRNPWFRANRVPVIEGVEDKFVISDGARTLDVYALQNIDEAAHVVAYLPAEKILFNADLYLPPAPNQQPPAVTTWMRELNQEIKRLKLNVEQDAGIHGAVANHAVFVKTMSAAAN
jgi:glyoxylase-like metal-dependent hydrolase (beta-lactamase superfamily II)